MPQHGLRGCKVMQFSGAVPVRLFPPPETGEGEGGGEGRWCAQAVLLPQSQPFPATASAEGRQFNGAPSPARGEGARGGSIRLQYVRGTRRCGG